MSLLTIDTDDAPTGSTLERTAIGNTRDPTQAKPPEQQQQPKAIGLNQPIQTGELKLDFSPADDHAPAPLRLAQLNQQQPHVSAQFTPPGLSAAPADVIERPPEPLQLQESNTTKPIETAKASAARRVSGYEQTPVAAAAATVTGLHQQTAGNRQPIRVGADVVQTRPQRAVTFVSPAASSQTSSASVISQHRHAVFSSDGPPASVAGVDSQIFFKDCWVCCCECPVWVGLFVFLMVRNQVPIQFKTKFKYSMETIILTFHSHVSNLKLNQFCLMLFISFFFWPKTITLNEKPNTYFMQPVDQYYKTVEHSHDFVRVGANQW